ncbi:hypothetical protein P8452_33479 [Trifolium repens]|nr:hypothetical protein P8452_33479 [Trifolium repens]
MGGSYGVSRSRIPHDHGGFFFLLRLPRGDDGRFLPILVVIVVVEGGYSLLRIDMLVGYFEKVVMFRRGRHLLSVSPLPFFPAKLTHLNLMGCIIGSSMNLGLCPDFGPYPSPGSYFSFHVVIYSIFLE